MTASPEVLLFTDADVFAGTERHIAELAGAARTGGIGVHVGCPDPSPLADQARAAGVEVVPIAKAGAADRRAVAAVAGFLKGGPGRIVHCHNGRTALIAAVARGRAGQGRVVLTQHFLCPSYATRRGWRAVASNALHAWVDRRIDHTIAISDAVREGVIERGEAPAAGVTRVHNGVSVGPGPGGEARSSVRSEVRQQLRLAPDAPLVVSAARLEQEKRVDVLVEAMAAVSRRLPAARCVVAGDGAERTSLEARIRRAGCGESVRLLGFRDDVKRLIAAADVFVLPADAEPFGLVVLEAMEAAVPVVATDAGGPREIVVPGETGWLVRPGDPGALAAAIVEGLHDPGLAERYGNAGRDRLLQHFTAERMARETIAVYERVLARGQR